MKIDLTKTQKFYLEQQQRVESNSDISDRIKAILLANEGWTQKQIAQALRIHVTTVWSHLNDYLLTQKLSNESGGSSSKLKVKKLMTNADLLTNYPIYLINHDVNSALLEDLGYNNIDYSANLLHKDQLVKANIIAKSNMVLCGSLWVNQTLRAYDNSLAIIWYYQDGDYVNIGNTICTINGNAKSIVTIERTILNFLQTLSATATITHEYITLTKNTISNNCNLIHNPINPDIKIMDTRKTIPHLRLAQKYAVRVGGGHNQRLGLYDAVLIKENHIKAFGSIANILHHAQIITPAYIPIQIEVESKTQLIEAMNHKATLILLDNMSVTQIIECVNLKNNFDKNIQLEVSGGINIHNIVDYILTGIDRISIGALTKNINAIDLSLTID